MDEYARKDFGNLDIKSLDTGNDIDINLRMYKKELENG